MRRLGLVVAALATVVAMKAERADACSFAVGVFERRVIPSNDGVAVPVNAEIRVVYDVWFDIDPGGAFDGAVSVRPAGGANIDAAVETVMTDARVTLVVRPAVPLEPNTTYEVLDSVSVPCQNWEPSNCIDAEASVVATFETGTSADEVAPTFAGLASLGSSTDRSEEFNSCGEWASVTFSLRWDAATDDSEDDWILYNVYSHDGTLELAYAHSLGAAGEALCDGGHPLFSQFWGQTGEYFVRAVDVAGNEDNNDVRFATKLCSDVPPGDGDGGDGGDSDDGGCSVPSRRGGAVWLVVLALAVLPRRRYRAR